MKKLGSGQRNELYEDQRRKKLDMSKMGRYQEYTDTKDTDTDREDGTGVILANHQSHEDLFSISPSHNYNYNHSIPTLLYIYSIGIFSIVCLYEYSRSSKVVR